MACSIRTGRKVLGRFFVGFSFRLLKVLLNVSLLLVLKFHENLGLDSSLVRELNRSGIFREIREKNSIVFFLGD